MPPEDEQVMPLTASEEEDQALLEAHEQLIQQQLEGDVIDLIDSSVPMSELGENLFKDWCFAFEQYSVNSGYYGPGAFHLVFGQLPAIRAITIREGQHIHDSRVHLAYMAPTAAGKGEGWKFISDICVILDLKTQSIDETNTAALVGSNTKTSDGIEMEGTGWLNPNNGVNIFCFSEASNIIKDPRERDPNAQPVMNLLQKVMNDYGTKDNQVSKKLTYGELIEYNPSCSIMLTSFILDYMNELIIKRGLFQRLYFYIREVSTDDRLKDLTDIKKNKKANLDVNVMKASIASRLLLINNSYAAAGITEMTYDEAAEEVFEEDVQNSLRRVKTLHPLTQEALAGFVTRFKKLQLKIAMHFACLNLHKKIEKRDAELAIHYTEKLLQTLMDYFTLRVEPNRNELRVYETVLRLADAAVTKLREAPRYQNKTQDFYRVEDVTKMLMTQNRMADHTAELHVRQLRTWDVATFQTDPKKGIEYMRLKPEAIESLNRNKKKQQ